MPTEDQSISTFLVIHSFRLSRLSLPFLNHHNYKLATLVYFWILLKHARTKVFVWHFTNYPRISDTFFGVPNTYGHFMIRTFISNNDRAWELFRMISIYIWSSLLVQNLARNGLPHYNIAPPHIEKFCQRPIVKVFEACSVLRNQCFNSRNPNLHHP